ncbi:peptidoglycan-binding protein [Streptomyces sp. NPDC058301]|uniref:peptidoglycan-binding domain-containing protein n=1 Tax=Streptomyces sp. NPDC058301 TaxID=3346436 RepID=UPI0036ED7E15
MKQVRILVVALVSAGVLSGAGMLAPADAATSAATRAPSAAGCGQSRPFLSQGDRGTCVRFLQQKLTDQGISTRVDGIFGSGTTKSVKSFQYLCGYRGREVDGLVGPRTWAGLLDHACV